MKHIAVSCHQALEMQTQEPTGGCGAELRDSVRRGSRAASTQAVRFLPRDRRHVSCPGSAKKSSWPPPSSHAAPSGGRRHPGGSMCGLFGRRDHHLKGTRRRETERCRTKYQTSGLFSVETQEISRCGDEGVGGKTNVGVEREGRRGEEGNGITPE